jgi:hypothetical protein
MVVRRNNLDDPDFADVIRLHEALREAEGLSAVQQFLSFMETAGS